MHIMYNCVPELVVPAVWPVKSIDRYNLAALVLHATSATLLFALTISNEEWLVYSTVNHVDWLPVNASDVDKRCDDVQCRVNVTVSTLGTIQLEGLVIAFHLMSVVAHFCNRYVFRATYMEWLKRKMNPGRWLEYFFSASLMQVVIMCLSGFTNVWVLVLSSVMIGVTQFFGHATEQYLWACRTCSLSFWERWQFFFFGWFSFLPPWVAIYYQFYYSVLNSDGAGPPEWVHAIIWSLLVTFVSFAAVMAWFVTNWTRRDVSFVAEKWYCILSLVSKTILTWQLYFGIFARAKNDLIAYNPSG